MIPYKDQWVAQLCIDHPVCADRVTYAVADLRGGVRDARPPPLRPNSFNFMQFLGEFGKIACSRPPLGGFTPPPWGNPGSVTDMAQTPSKHYRVTKAKLSGNRPPTI